MADKTNENLELWMSVKSTDKKFTKPYSGKGGFSGTAINAQSQKEKATGMFGIYGIGWGVKNQKFEVVKLNDNDKHNELVYTAVMYFSYDGSKGEFDIESSIEIVTSKGYKNNDIYKKVKTDALTKGLSHLGFNADIFMQDFSDNKYLYDEKTIPEKKENITPELLKQLLESGTGEQIRKAKNEFIIDKDSKVNLDARLTKLKMDYEAKKLLKDKEEEEKPKEKPKEKLNDSQMKTALALEDIVKIQELIDKCDLNDIQKKSLETRIEELKKPKPTVDDFPI